MLFRWVVSMFLAGLLAGCASDRGSFVSPEQFTRTRVAKAEARTLRSGDDVELSVEVNGSREVPLTKMELGYNGDVPAPLVGDVALDGLTLAQAREVLVKAYGRIFTTTPLVTLRMANDKLAGEWGYVTVLGQVSKPGRYTIGSSVGMTLSDALHAAGGFADSADIKGVIVTRQTEAGQMVQCKCDITKLGLAASGQMDLTLFDGDVVQVPERLF